jgi:integrase
LHLHDLRHSGLTAAARTGATTKAIMQRAGHTAPRTAMRYQHAAAEDDRRIAEALALLVVA